MKKPWNESPMMKAVHCRESDSVPVWLMRQAGRYMPEYRTIREKVSFLELCKNPSLAAEVMLTAVDRLNVDAAIIFSDILLLLEPMGFQLDFLPEGGPKIGNPVTSPEDVKRVHKLDDIGHMGYVMDVVKYTREGLDDRLPLIGFAGAPFTLAVYAIEGGPGRDCRQTKRFMRLYPNEWNELMKKFALSTARYLNAQIASGAQIVQIFDSWIGCLSVEDYQYFAQPFTKMIVDLIGPGTPIIHFGPGNPSLLPNLRDAGGHVLGVDWRISIDKAWEMIGPEYAIQGNLDPTVLLTNPDIIRKEVQHILRQVERRSGFIFNLGTGIMPQTPVENAVALVEAVHELGMIR